MEPKKGGVRIFLTIWSGQLISSIGSQLTGFALGVWVYDQTHSLLLLQHQGLREDAK